MIKFLFIIGNPVHSNQEQLILDLIPRALHSVACSQVEKVDGDCSELLHALAAEPSDSWEKTTNGLKCSVHKATFELLFDASFADVRGALRNALKQPAARRVIVYVGAVGQNAYGAPPTGSQTLASGCSCSSAWLLRDAQVGPAELAPVVAECEEYLANVLHLARLDRRNSIALLQNGHADDKETQIELGTVELLVPFADADWLALEKRTSTTASYTVSVGALENATASADDGVTDTVAQLAARLAQAVHFESVSRSLVASDVVGNIRFSRPTLYVFASGDGDAALLGVPGFAMLLDGGYSAQPAYWQLIRHLDRIDAVLVSHAALDNLFGLVNILRQKAATDAPNSTPTPPVLAHALLNSFTFGSGEPRLPASAPTLTLDALKVHSVTEADELVRLLATNRIPVSPLLRAAGQPLTPINLYHKIGQGSFDLYVLNPTDCAKELKELGAFCEKLLRDADLHTTLQPDADTNNKGSKPSPSPADRRQPTVNVGTHTFPLGDFASVCALLVYHPASPAESVTRLLFTGACPQLKVLEGLERMRNAEFLKLPEYHDVPTLSLPFSNLPASASHFGIAAAASSRASITSPSSAASARKLDTPAGRTPTTRSTTALKAPATSAPSRTAGPSKTNVPAPKRTTANGHASAADSKASKAVPAKKLVTAPAKNSSSTALDANRPKTAPAGASTKPAPTPLRKPAPAANGAAASAAKIKPLANKQPVVAAPSKRTAKDNSAVLSVTSANGNDKPKQVNGGSNLHHYAPLNGDDYVNHNVALNGNDVNHSTHLNGDDDDVNHSVPLNGDDVNHSTHLNGEDKQDHIELQTTNGDATPADSQPSPQVETTESTYEQHTNGDDAGDVEVEVEMTAEEFARALAAASGDPDAATNWGISLGLPMLTDGDGDGDGHDDDDATHADASANGHEHVDEVNTQAEAVADAYTVAHSAPVAETPAAAPADAAPTAKANAAGRAGVSQKAPASGSKQPARSASATTKQPAAKAAPSSAKAADGKKQPSAAAPAPRQPASARSAKAAPPSTSKGASTSPTKERAGNATRSSNSGNAGGAASGPCGVPFFVDLAYIPAHGNPKYVDTEFFRRVRARYYVLSCLQPSAKVLDALLDAKATVWDSQTQTTLIPTYDSEQLAIWMTANRERLAELQVDVAPPANRCTVQLQDHTDQCNAYRLEF